ncbi:MAG: RidA family protein [Pseudomonadales bacterium]
MSDDRICQKLEQLGLVLPAPMQLPPGMVAKFPMVRVIGQRALVSGHGPLNADGTIAQPLGKVGTDLDIEQAVHAAQLTTLAILSSLKAELGSLNRITAWGRVMGMVNAAPGFNKLTPVIDGFSDLINELFPADVAPHSRAAVGMAELPMGLPVEIEAEVYFE